MILKKPPLEIPALDPYGNFSQPWREFFNQLYRLFATLERVTAATEPTLTDGQIRIWRDSAANKVYLVYHDKNEGQHKVELV